MIRLNRLDRAARTDLSVASRDVEAFHATLDVGEIPVYERPARVSARSRAAACASSSFDSTRCRARTGAIPPLAQIFSVPRYREPVFLSGQVGLLPRRCYGSG